MIVIVGCLLLTPLALWAQQPKSGGTLRVAWEADITGLDPYISPGVQSWYVAGNLFNSLLTIDSELNYVPDLAESWEILEDGKVYVFHLRKGVKFHDGTDFDAEAVRWNYQRIMDPAEKAFVAPFYTIVDTVEVVDAHTVKFTLKHPSMTLLPVMAADRAGFLQMSPAAFKKWGKEEMRLHPWAPARSSWRSGSRTRSSSWRKIPTTSSRGSPTWIASSLRIMKEGVTRVTALRTGEVDFAN